MFSRVAQFMGTFGQTVADAPALPDAQIRALRRSLLQEELNEFLEAHQIGDRVETADGLGDLVVIIAGTMLAYGIAPQGYDQEVIESPYDDFLDYLEHQDQSSFPREILGNAFAAYDMAENHDDLHWIELTLLNMLTSVFGVAFKLGIPLNAVFAEIHRSNMSKLDENGRPIYREDGKVIKSSLYSPPDLAPILKRG